MAMQKSEEIKETTLVLFKQFKELGASAAQVSICVFDEQVRKGEMYVTLNGEKIDRSIIMDLDKEVFVMKKAKQAFLNKQKDFSATISGKELQQYNQWRNSFVSIKGWDESEAILSQSWHVNAAWFSKGMMAVSSNSPASVETIKLLERFASVFDLTYTRFLDLQKAEAQAKEAQIELALERVRARTMAMQKSDELSETVYILFQQFKELGENPDQATIGVINENEWVIEYWVTMYGNQTNRMYKFPIDEPNVTNKIYQAWKEQKKSLVIELSGKELYDFSTFREGMGGAAYNEQEKKRVINVAFFSRGLINVQSNELRSAESIRLLERFAGVFEQTYTRFLDLQKAEAQAREAQIEASLERVRSKTMAMHSSNDVGDTVATMFDEFVKLNIHTNRCGILICSDEPAGEVWTAKSNPEGKANLIIGKLDLTVHPLLHGIHKAWKKKETFYTYSMEGDDLRNYYQELNDLEYYPVKFDMNALPSKEFHSDFYFPEGSVFTFTSEPLPDEASRVIKRFAAVFGQTYRRFLDLQKAEAQAREAEIELGLERVRARAMAMQKSDEILMSNTV